MTSTATASPRADPATVQLVDGGQDFYAAQTWFGLPAGRQVWLGWMGNWRYPYSLPTELWKGTMSIPRELSLEAHGDALILRQQPIPELKALRREAVRLDHVSVTDDIKVANASSFEFELVFFPGPTRSGIRVFASPEHWVEIGVDRPAGALYVDRSRSGFVTVTDRTGGPFDFGSPRTVPLVSLDLPVRLRGFVDRSTVEIFSGDGTVLSLTAFPDPTDTGVTVFSQSGMTEIESLQLYQLASIWD